MPLPHNLFDYCSIRKSNFIEKYLVVKRKISFVYKADILLTKLIIRGVTFGEHNPLLKHGTDMAPRRILHIVEMILLEFF